MYGIKRLRVADASVFPQVTTGNTMAPVLMVAERAADFVREFWKDTPDKNWPDKLRNSTSTEP